MNRTEYQHISDRDDPEDLFLITELIKQRIVDQPSGCHFFNKTYGDDSWNKNNVHDLFCSKFRYPEVLPNGEVVDKWVETSKLNKQQMTDFMNKIQGYMATEHGVAVPLPDDDKYKDFQAIYS